jgi:outer membrane protein
MKFPTPAVDKHSGRARGVAPASLLLAALIGTGGCRGPISADAEDSLRSTVRRSLEAEIERLDGKRTAAPLTRDISAQDLDIKAEYLDEIERSYNPMAYPTGAERPGILGEDLQGDTPETVAIGLERAVRSAVERNLLVQEATLGPAISEATVAAAESAFDWVFFSDLTWTDRDTPQAGPGFIPGLNEVRDSLQSVQSTTGLRRSLVTGGQFSASNDIVYSDLRATAFGVLPNPNPGTTVSVNFQLDQPLLRGFGADVGLANVRLARNAERAAIAGLKSNLIATVTETESAYWDLVRAYRELSIVQAQLERGIEVRDDIKARLVLDAVQAQVADATARVESRKGDLLRAQRSMRRASDRLKALINDPSIPVGSEILLIPSDDAIDEPIVLSLVEEITRAVEHRPEIDTALLAIDDASIRETVAKNGLLPSLDLRAQASLLGFDEYADRAYNEIGDNEFLDNFVLGLFFEQPIGNRGPEAEFRRRRLERMRSVIAYRRAVQDTVLGVKNALDDVKTNYRLIEQARASRIAAAEALRTLLVEKELTDRGYTVERLNVELGQQDSLAAAERAEVAALIDYNRAIARLAEATGTTLERNRINFVVPDANQIEERERADGLRAVASDED